MTTFVARYDFRGPGADGAERSAAFAQVLDQAAYLDGYAWDAVSLSEHHASPDGYLTSPLLVAAAMAARTRRLPITVAALLVNFYHPARLAEDLAVLDHLSGGRLAYILGVGYRREEYDLLGRPWATRGADAEEAISRLLAAWAAEPEATLLTKPHPLLFYGGGTSVAAQRAARLGLNFAPQVSDQALAAEYRQACEQAGRPPGLVMMPPPGPAYVFCSSDPDRFWAHHGEHLLADAVVTRAWHGRLRSAVLDGSTTVAQLRASGRYLVLTPKDLIAKCRSREIRHVTTHPLCCGLPEEPSWEALTLVCERVLPALAGNAEP